LDFEKQNKNHSFDQKHKNDVRGCSRTFADVRGRSRTFADVRGRSREWPKIALNTPKVIKHDQKMTLILSNFRILHF